jgi:hypothetical protein
MAFSRFRPSHKALIFILLLSLEGVVLGQSYVGTVLSNEDNSIIPYVNVGIIGKNVGTVTDATGNFKINLEEIYNNDSVRFSMIGYEPKSFLVSTFRNRPVKEVYLSPVCYHLCEVKVKCPKTRDIMLGDPVTSDELKSGFADNELGSELGIKVSTKGKVRLENINLNVATCTYDSVTYRLNIYQAVNKNDFKNILTEPIYISFSKDNIEDVITLDLKKYFITIEGNVLITLELYKDLGQGRLLFYTQYFTGSTFHRKTSEGKWSAAPGAIGMYINGQFIKNDPSRSKNNSLAD